MPSISAKASASRLSVAQAPTSTSPTLRLVFNRDGADQIQPGVPSQAEVQMPQVDVPSVIKAASGIAALVCLFSLCVWFSTGFYVIYPPLSVLIAVFSAVFYGMGEAL